MGAFEESNRTDTLVLEQGVSQQAFTTDTKLVFLCVLHPMRCQRLGVACSALGAKLHGTVITHLVSAKRYIASAVYTHPNLLVYDPEEVGGARCAQRALRTWLGLGLWQQEKEEIVKGCCIVVMGC